MDSGAHHDDNEESGHDMANKQPKSNAQDDHDAVIAMADRLGLTGTARRNYVHKHMTGFGHRAVINYVEGGDDDDDDDGGFFSGGGNRRRSGGSRHSDEDSFDL